MHVLFVASAGNHANLSAFKSVSNRFAELSERLGCPGQISLLPEDLSKDSISLLPEDSQIMEQVYFVLSPFNTTASAFLRNCQSTAMYLTILNLC